MTTIGQNQGQKINTLYINKPHCPDGSVVRQISTRADGYQVVNNMNNSSRFKFQTRRLLEWIPIRDIPDKEPQGPPNHEPGMAIERRLPPN